MNDWDLQDMLQHDHEYVCRTLRQLPRFASAFNALRAGQATGRAVLPFGIKAIDERLPEGGLALGAVHEVAGGR